MRNRLTAVRISAVASQFADRVLAVDPLYGQSVATLEQACDDAIERTVSQLREKRDLFVWDEYGDVETRGRYLRAGLPDLPFESNGVDLVLSANLLFLYDDRLDESFHVDSLLELARVAREEIRVFPLHSLDRGRSRLVETVVEQVRQRGLTVRFESVSYEFQPGATETLVVAASDAHSVSTGTSV